MAHQAPIYIRIQNFIRAGIAERLFEVGERLPSEPELAARFSTTRATVARALQELAYEGLIERRIGSGTFVANKPLSDRVDTNVVESFEDHVRASGQTLTYKLLAFEPDTAPAASAQHINLAAGDPVYRIERSRVVSGRVRAIEHRYVAAHYGAAMKQAWLETLTIQQVFAQCLGIAIGGIDNWVRATNANARLARLLDVSRGASLLVREHVLLDERGAPLLHGETTYHPEFAIRYSLRGPR